MEILALIAIVLGAVMILLAVRNRVVGASEGVLLAGGILLTVVGLLQLGVFK